MIIFKRKIYNKLLDWKTAGKGRTALLIEGARRIGKSTIVKEFARKEYRSYLLIDFNNVSHPKNLKEADNTLFIPAYMTFCL